MMRWLARLLHERRKKPRRPEATVFLAHPDPVMGVLTETADVITGTLTELSRRHRQGLQARQTPPPLPAPRPTTEKDASSTTPRPPSKPASGRQQPPPTPAPARGARSKDAAILADLKLASTAKQRKEAAMKHPELRPPHDALDDRENAILELAFWQGLTYKEVGTRFAFSAGWAAQVVNKALRKLTYHLHRGGSLGEATPRLPDRLDEFRRANSASRRMAVAARHPELRPPHAFLQPRENDVLGRFYWQGQTFDTIAEHHGLDRKQTGKVRDDALQKLDWHYRCTRAQELHARQQEKREDGVLRTNNQPPSPLVVLGEDARITAFLRAGPAEKRRAVAQRHPELRPPQPCLSGDENDLLELAFWQARTYREIAELKNIARKDVGTRLRKALRKLDQHLQGESHEDEDRLGEVLLALNECGSVRQAAKKLKVPKDVLKAFMEREGIKTRFVFEVEP